MNTITAAIGSMSLRPVYGKHRAFELFPILRSHYKMTTETGEDGQKRCIEPMNVLSLVMAMVEEV